MTPALNCRDGRRRRGRRGLGDDDAAFRLARRPGASDGYGGGEHQGDQQRCAHRHTACQGYLKGQIDASHRRDAGVQSAVLQSDERVQREQNLAFEIHLQAGRQRQPPNAFRQRDEGLGRRRQEHLTSRSRIPVCPHQGSAPPRRSTSRVTLGAASSSSPAGVVVLVSRFDRHLRLIRKHADPFAPEPEPDVGMRPESSSSAGGDEREMRPRDTQAAEAFSRTRREAHRGHQRPTRRDPADRCRTT